MTERPETPAGEPHADEPAPLAELAPVDEPGTVAQPASAALGAPPSPTPTVLPPRPAATALVSESDRPENAADRPEIQIGAALAGGFVLALILKRLAR